VNTGRNGDYSHPNFASAQDLDAIRAELTEAGIEHEILQPTDGKPQRRRSSPLAVTHTAGLVVLGAAPSYTGRQADHRQHGAARAARRQLSCADDQGSPPEQRRKGAPATC
jgi:hypothetical protein